MESRPFKIGYDKDRIGALPDHLLLEILERVDLRQAVSAGAVSTRWRHLPHQLSRLDLYADDFHGAACSTPHEIMEAYTGTTCRLLSAKCDCKSNRAIHTLTLGFYLSAPHLSSIGQAVEDVVSLSKTRRLEFTIVVPLPRPPSSRLSVAELTESGRQFMSFSRAYPVVFRGLTRLTLQNLAFGDTDVADLITACDRLTCLKLGPCRLVEKHSPLKIDAPCSHLQKLEFDRFSCTQVHLVCVPKLRKVACFSWRSSPNPPVRFGYVPELRNVYLASHARVGQAPFTLSEFLPRSAGNLSKLHLNFFCQMIWIQPEHPKQLAAIFRNMTDVHLTCVFPECDLSWTLFILEAAPTLQNFKLSRTRHSCVKRFKDSAEKTNVVWEPSKDLKHLNLKLLTMKGFEEEDKVTNYIRLVMERAMVLKRIELYGTPCNQCDAITPESHGRFTADEASRHRIKERLTHGSPSSVEIIIT